MTQAVLVDVDGTVALMGKGAPDQGQPTGHRGQDGDLGGCGARWG